jgi:hypothetical protein
MAATNLHPDFKEFLTLLNSEGVKYILLGGYAVNYHGYQRFTGDMDVWVSTARDNAVRLSRALERFGFPPTHVAPSRFQEQGQVFQMGRVPVRIDILTAPSGVEFDKCYARRVSTKLDGVPVAVISLEDLRVNKMASARTKDLADLEQLPPSASPEASRQVKKKQPRRNRKR